MKNFKRFASVVMVIMMMLSMMLPAMAQTVGTVADNTGSITISNAARGETYTVYKLFDASVTGTEGGSIAYTGTIPDSLKDYFTVDTAGNITATDAAMNTNKTDMSDGLKAALKEWAKTATAAASEESDGTELVFAGLNYGYYVVTTTQGEQAITVDSTNPTVTIIDKNTSTPTELKKEVDNNNVNIGDTVTYTVTFITSNYKDGKDIITEYTIEDTLPEFLDNVTVTSIIIDNDAKTETTNDQTNVTKQFIDKKIVLEWYDENAKQFKYENGALVTMTYTAVVTDKVAIDGAGNINEVTVSYLDAEPMKKTETIYTYAIAIKKVDQSGKALEGATFQFPFYVKKEADTDGAYIYAGTTADDGLVNELTTPADGLIIVKGVASGIKYSITETEAPLGYNKLTAPVEVTAVKTGSTTTSTTTYLDKDGNVVSEETEGGSTVLVAINELAATSVVVVNKTGTELPSTGGIGTTIFYCTGAILALGAFVLLVTKKRMSREG